MVKTEFPQQTFCFQLLGDTIIRYATVDIEWTDSEFWHANAHIKFELKDAPFLQKEHVVIPLTKRGLLDENWDYVEYCKGALCRWLNDKIQSTLQLVKDMPIGQ